MRLLEGIAENSAPVTDNARQPTTCAEDYSATEL
jgi:hypothetical protein